MGVKKVIKYGLGMALAGYVGYEMARRQCRTTHGTSRETTESTGEYGRSGEYYAQEPRDPRDYRSIYNL